MERPETPPLTRLADLLPFRVLLFGARVIGHASWWIAYQCDRRTGVRPAHPGDCPPPDLGKILSER